VLVECPCVVLLTFLLKIQVDAHRARGCVCGVCWLHEPVVAEQKMLIVGALLGVWGSTWCPHCMRVLMRVVWVVVPGWLTGCLLLCSQRLFVVVGSTSGVCWLVY